MRRAYGEALVELGRRREDVVVLSADVSNSDYSFLFLFDETRTISAGRTVYQLSLVAPGSLLGAHGTRYRKAALASGDVRIDGFAAARTPDALYVLVSQGNLKLLRIALAS